MPLTRDFRETVKARADRDPKFRRARISEAVQCFLSGDVETGKSLLRDFINALVGFEPLAIATSHSAKSLMRMFSPQGNQQARNLFDIVGYLQKKEGLRLEVHSTEAARRPQRAQVAAGLRRKVGAP